MFNLLNKDLSELDKITDNPDDPNNIPIIMKVFGITESEAKEMINNFKQMDNF
jgi:hypothetical protein